MKTYQLPTPQEKLWISRCLNPIKIRNDLLQELADMEHEIEKRIAAGTPVTHKSCEL